MSWEYPSGATAQLDRALMGLLCDLVHYDARGRLDLRPYPASGHCRVCDRPMCDWCRSFQPAEDTICGKCEWDQLSDEEAP